MTQTNLSIVINNYFTNNENADKKQKVYSVIVTHESEVHENYLYTDRDKAIAKMKSVVEKWKNGMKQNGFAINEYRHCNKANFTPQYKTKLGYWYENGEWEYGCVELVECVLE